MIEIEFPHSNKTFYLPSNLAECNEKEYKAICIMLFDFYQGLISYTDLRVQIAAYLLGYKFSKKTTEESLASLVMISESLDSFFADVNNQKVINMDYIDSKIPVLSTLFTKYYSPNDGFEQMTYGQYADASRFYLMYNDTGDIDLLYIMMAILYNRKGKKYSSDAVDKKVATLKRDIIPGIAFGVYLQFAAFQKHLVTATINWGGKEIDLSILFEGEASESDMPGLGADSLVFTLAEAGTLGKVSEVRDTKFWEIMLLMYDLRKRDLESKKRSENVKN